MKKKQNRTELVQFRVTKAEKKKMEEEAELAQRKLSDWARLKCLK